MQEDILINWSPQETRVAVVESGAVQELHVERTLERGLVGNVYLGKVARVLPGMQSAFIDIGLERAAFLHVADVWHRPAEGETISASRAAQAQVPIERQIFEGQALTVQVIKDPIGSKGARLSTQKHQQAPGNADLRGQPGPLAANRVLDDLHCQRLAFKYLPLDRHLRLGGA